MSVNRGYNDLNINSFKYEWTIKKFAVHVKLWLLPDDPSHKDNITMESPSFSLDDNLTKWYLSLSISNSNEKSPYGISLWAEFQGEGQQPKKKMEIQCRFVNNNTKKKYNVRTIYHVFSSDEKKDSITLGEIPTELLSDDIGHSHDDITIICHFHIVDGSSTSATNNSFSRVAKRNLPIDIEELFINKKFTDITFILGNKEIRAHKLILITLSPVFAAMFSHPMKELEDNEVFIDDIDYKVFEEMLRYIYTDDVSNLKCPVTKLLHAADKYGLEDLKEICAALLEKEITIDNAAETFIFAERYHLTQLSAEIQSFIQEHFQDFINSSGYDSMIDEYPELAKKVFKSPAPEA